jgi:ComF family protein
MALLSPPCAICANILTRVAAGAVCDECWRGVRFVTPPICVRCGDPLAAPRESAPSPSPCGCSQLSPDIHLARALGSYEGTLRLAIHALKYNGRRSVARRLAGLLVERCGSILADADAVIPVPLHPHRRWSRGFNQTEDIARHLNRPGWQVLRRVRHTPAQVNLTTAERRVNVSGAFAPRRMGRPSRVKGRCVVLFDDVSTTGATLAACAAVLAALGAAEIRALTIARTLRTCGPPLGGPKNVLPSPSAPSRAG